jgi:hypothetical protein
MCRAAGRDGRLRGVEGGREVGRLEDVLVGASGRGPAHGKRASGADPSPTPAHLTHPDPPALSSKLQLQSRGPSAAVPPLGTLLRGVSSLDCAGTAVRESALSNTCTSSTPHPVMAKRARSKSASSGSDDEMSGDEASSTKDVASPQESVGSDHPAKYAHTNRSGASVSSHAVMHCQLPPHKDMKFDSYAAYEIHYQQAHINRCSECNKNFPSEHYLHLHIAEHHDPIRAIKQERGEKTVHLHCPPIINLIVPNFKQYSCFVEDCSKVCADPHKRKMHCIDKHGFPQVRI